VNRTTATTRFLLLAAAALAVAACGMGTRIAYNNVGTVYSNAAPMLSWMVDDYVDMTSAQKDWVRERFTRALAWHRSAELPAYRRLLESVAQKAEAPFTPEDVTAVWRELRGTYDRTLEYLLPHVADFVLQLDPEQVAGLERKFAEDNKRMAKELGRGSAEEKLGRRTERSIAHLEEFTGRLSASQKKLVADHTRGFLDTTEQRMAERRVRQAQTLALLRARPDRERLVAGLRRLLVEVNSWRQPEYREMLRTREAQTVAMIVALSETLTAEQREHLQRRLRGYAAEFRTLAAAS
jgi:hypothetical protein